MSVFLSNGKRLIHFALHLNAVSQIVKWFCFWWKSFVQVQNTKVYWYWYLKANPKINKTTIFRPMFVNYSSSFLKIQKRPRLFVSSHSPLFWSPTEHGRVKRHHRKGRENKQMINQMTEGFLVSFFLTQKSRCWLFCQPSYSFHRDNKEAKPILWVLKKLTYVKVSSWFLSQLYTECF